MICDTSGHRGGCPERWRRILPRSRRFHRKERRGGSPTRADAPRCREYSPTPSTSAPLAHPSSAPSIPANPKKTCAIALVVGCGGPLWGCKLQRCHLFAPNSGLSRQMVRNFRFLKFLAEHIPVLTNGSVWRFFPLAAVAPRRRSSLFYFSSSPFASLTATAPLPSISAAIR